MKQKRPNVDNQCRLLNAWTALLIHVTGALLAAALLVAFVRLH
jgi:hypothetical protein